MRSVWIAVKVVLSITELERFYVRQTQVWCEWRLAVYLRR